MKSERIFIKTYHRVISKFKNEGSISVPVFHCIPNLQMTEGQYLLTVLRPMQFTARETYFVSEFGKI